MRNEYCAYLRKSRADEEAEARGVGETLARHEQLLMETARKLGISITAFYREIVSGDSIAARPQMQKLLADVEAGAWAGVLCVDITRLARGETIDQGIVAQSFKYSGTKIITPLKTYDPLNEFDEEYFEFGLFMARREYKMINQRQQRGRIASIKEGKWVSHKVPYGYRRIKLQNEKGWTLEPDEHAPIVLDIYKWYTGEDCERIGTALIARRLNEAGIPSPSGADWLPHAIRNILANPAYVGMVAWGRRPAQKTYQDGELRTTRPRKKEPDLLVPGRHPAIVPQELYDRAAALIATNKSRPGPKQVQMKNPFSGILYCAKCGRAMSRRPYQNGRQETILCAYTSCDNISSDLQQVEKTLLDSLRLWLAAFERDAAATPGEDEALATARRTIAAHSREQEKLAAQLDRAYELVEQGVYTPEIFLDRSRKIAARQKELSEATAALQLDISKREQIALARQAIAPQMVHVLDAYPQAQTAEEKNALLKSVLEKVTYRKDQRDRWGGDGIHLDIYPLIPKF